MAGRARILTRSSTKSQNWEVQGHQAGSAMFSEHVALCRRTITSTTVKWRCGITRLLPDEDDIFIIALS